MPGRTEITRYSCFGSISPQLPAFLLLPFLSPSFSVSAFHSPAPPNHCVLSGFYNTGWYTPGSYLLTMSPPPAIICASTNRQIQIKKHTCPVPNTHCLVFKDLLKASERKDLLEIFLYSFPEDIKGDTINLNFPLSFSAVPWGWKIQNFS